MINNEYTEPHAGFNDEDKENILNNEAPDPTMESEASQKQDAGNSAKRAAGVAAATLAGAASATAAGTYYIHNQEAAEEETDNATPQAEVVEATHPPHSSHPQPEPQPEPQPQPQPEPQPQPQPEPTPQPQPNPVNPEEPTVEILGVEVTHTENGDITLGSVAVDGEEYVLIDVDGGDFDLAWHDANHNQEAEPEEITDISQAHINVNEFVQAAGQNDAMDVPPTDDGNMITNTMDPVNPGEIDYLDPTDATGLL